MSRVARFTYADIQKFPKEVQESIYRQIADKTSNVEQHTINVPKITDALKITDKGCSIHIHSIRKRLTDSDGICAKFAIDAIVLAGIIENDDPSIVKEVSYSQEKGEPEQTIITINY
jgi:hypothetical protein